MRVRFRDTDQQGHVYFGSYFELCDEAYSAYMRAVGFPWQQLVDGGTDMFYASAHCDYLGSARFEDLVHVEVSVARIGETSITTEYVVRSDAGDSLAKASLVSVCVDPSTRTKKRVPDAFREAVATFERETAAAKPKR